MQSGHLPRCFRPLPPAALLLLLPQALERLYRSGDLVAEAPGSRLPLLLGVPSLRVWIPKRPPQHPGLRSSRAVRAVPMNTRLFGTRSSSKGNESGDRWASPVSSIERPHGVVYVRIRASLVARGAFEMAQEAGGPVAAESASLSPQGPRLSWKTSRRHYELLRRLGRLLGAAARGRDSKGERVDKEWWFKTTRSSFWGMMGARTCCGPWVRSPV